MPGIEDISLAWWITFAVGTPIMTWRLIRWKLNRREQKRIRKVVLRRLNGLARSE